MRAGELTYTLYKECIQFVTRNGRSFTVYCTVVGALVCCLLELYRLRISKYEDEKIAENGEALARLG